jgi:hypothetical protein
MEKIASVARFIRFQNPSSADHSFKPPRKRVRVVNADRKAMRQHGI